MFLQYLMRYAAMGLVCLTQTNLPVYFKDKKSGKPIAQPLRTIAAALRRNEDQPGTSTVFFGPMMMSNVGFTKARAAAAVMQTGKLAEKVEGDVHPLTVLKVDLARSEMCGGFRPTACGPRRGIERRGRPRCPPSALAHFRRAKTGHVSQPEPQRRTLMSSFTQSGQSSTRCSECAERFTSECEEWRRGPRFLRVKKVLLR